MARETAFKRMKTRSCGEWQRLIKEIKCPAMRGKVASLALWDLFTDGSRRVPAILKIETRKYVSIKMERCINRNLLKLELIKIGYPKPYAKKRSVIPMAKLNKKGDENEVRKNNHQSRDSDLCPFMRKRGGAQKVCIGAPPFREGGPEYDSEDNASGRSDDRSR